MNWTNMKNAAALILSLVLSTGSPQLLPGYQATEPTPAPSPGGATDSAPMSASQLQSLVAPIALYPDQLVAQILAAATFPDQVAIASYWLQQHADLKGKHLEKEVEKQSWDASVKALSSFPSVLSNMAKNLTWTSSLGEAYHNQAADVMKAVQVLRAQAKDAGNLKSGSQITVVQQSPDTIVIQPANPQVVYVPEYNPAVVYGVPYVIPGYTAGDVAAAGVLGFGAGIAVGAMMGGGGGWGWGAWDCNWHGGAVVYNHNTFYGNTAWHGGYYNGGYHAGAYGYHGGAYNGNFNRNINANVNRNANFNAQSHDNMDRFGSSNSWAHNDSGFGKSNAFSGFSHDSGGWGSRASSQRGWGSMRAGGFGGGRFGGSGFGGGHFGGFRR
jgi:hypothetical protein